MDGILESSGDLYERSLGLRVHPAARSTAWGMILDWSDTTADVYVIAPAVVFVEVFKRQGVEISMTEARGPMDLRNRERR